MDSNWYERIAKSGWLGSRAKVSADTGRADWSSKPQAQDGMAKALLNMKDKVAKPSPEDKGSAY